MNPERRVRWSVALSLFAAIVWWGFSSVRSAASLVISRDPVEYMVGAIALLVFLLAARRLPARGSIVMIALFGVYTILQTFARDQVGKVQVLSLLAIVFPISFFAIGYVLWQGRRYATPLKIYVVTMAFSALIGLGNYFTGFAEPLFLINQLDRAEVGSEVVQRGGSLASNSIGTGLLVGLGLLVALGFRRRYWWSIPIFAASLLSTLSRGGIIAISAGLPVVIGLNLPGTRRRRTFILGAALAGLMAMGILASMDSSRVGGNVVVDRYIGDLLNPKEEGNASRIASWENALDVWTESPILGAGLGRIGTIGVIDARERGRFALAAESWYLQILAEEGVVGLALYLLALMGLVIEGWTAISWAPKDDNRRVAVGVMAGMVALAFGGIFLQNLNDLIGTLFWYFAGGLVAYRTELGNLPPKNRALHRRASALPEALVIISLLETSHLRPRDG